MVLEFSSKRSPRVFQVDKGRATLQLQDLPSAVDSLCQKVRYQYSLRSFEPRMRERSSVTVDVKDDFMPLEPSLESLLGALVGSEQTLKLDNCCFDTCTLHSVSG